MTVIIDQFNSTRLVCYQKYINTFNSSNNYRNNNNNSSNNSLNRFANKALPSSYSNCYSIHNRINLMNISLNLEHLGRATNIDLNIIIRFVEDSRKHTYTLIPLSSYFQSKSLNQIFHNIVHIKCTCITNFTSYYC